MEDLYFDPAYYPDIGSKKKPLKRMLNRTVLFILGQSMQSLSKADKAIQAEVRAWPYDLRLKLQIMPDGGSMTVERTAAMRLRHIKAGSDDKKPDVTIYFKNIEAAFKVLTGQLGTDVAYARHYIAARGDISLSLSVTRVLNQVETYLFPAFIARRLVKRLPKIPFFRKQVLRLKAYFLGIPFGI